MFFLDFRQKFTEKCLKKLCFKLLLKAGRHANAGQLPEELPQICLFSVYLISYKCYFYKENQKHEYIKAFSRRRYTETYK